VRRVVYEGDPVAQIVAFAASENINLVIMSTHGYGSFRRFLIGSMAAKLLDDLPCRVLTGVHLDESPPSQRIAVSKIVCAVDLGPQTQSSLSDASQLAQDFNAALEVVYVIPPMPQFTAQPTGELEAREKLQNIVKETKAIAASIHLQEGDVADTVCSFSRSAGADLLVIGRGSREGSNGRLRTNAYAIIRQSPCPVLSV
jgi:nucleotide-binding universal stress UspA family protein